MASLSDNEMELINEHAISSFCMRELNESSKEHLVQTFSAYLYIYNNYHGFYEGFSQIKNIHNPQFLHGAYTIRVYAIVHAKYNPPIVYRHLMDKWVRRSPNPKNNQKPLLQLNDESCDNSYCTKDFLIGFSMGYEKGVNHSKEIV